MQKLNKLIMTVAGLLLIVAAGLKFHEMIDTCVPSWDIKTQAAITAAQTAGEQIPEWKASVLGFWESFEFFLIQIPLEFALGVWMVSGLFRKGSWIVGTLAYFFFIFVTFGKWVTGAESCGCFGQITVDPKITLFVMDIPVFLLLAIFWPKGTKLLPPPWPKPAYMLAIAIPVLAVMALAAPAMVALRPDCIKVEDIKPDESARLQLQIHKLQQEFQKKSRQVNELTKTVEEQKQQLQSLQQQLQTQQQTEQPPSEPAPLVTTAPDTKESQTESPETEAVQEAVEQSDQSTAVQQWDWLQYVVEDDVREQIAEGLVVVMMYRYDCAVCEDMAPRYSHYYKEMTEQGLDAFKIAFLEIPPYGGEDDVHVPEDTLCMEGKLTDERKWQLMSPVVVALLDGQLVKQWPQGTAPEPEDLLSEIFGE